MLIKTEKLSPVSNHPNACQRCGGQGKLKGSSFSGEHSFEMECPYCFGETLITPDFLARKQAAAILKRKLIDNRITIREASNRFGGTFNEWNDARNGKADLSEINRKINLISAQEAQG